jgi:hypothetical protein
VGRLEAHDQLVAVASRRESTDAKAWVHGAAACGDLEVPFVPRAPDERVRWTGGRLAVPDLDTRDDLPARAQRRAAMGAAVRERVEPAVDAEDGDAPRADLDDPDPTGGRGLAEWDASFARAWHAHAETGDGSR